MGFFELQLERNLKELAVHNEVYFGVDSYVGNSMHKIYNNFLEGKSTLIDMFQFDPELHKNLKELFTIISKNHAYFAKPSTTEAEKKAAAANAAAFTKKLPFYFPDVPITRKMHLLGFVVAPIIANDKTSNICYKYLRIEQLGERLHAICNLLMRSRFFSVRNGGQQLLNLYMEYENSLYVKK